MSAKMTFFRVQKIFGFLIDLAVMGHLRLRAGAYRGGDYNTQQLLGWVL